MILVLLAQIKLKDPAHLVIIETLIKNVSYVLVAANIAQLLLIVRYVKQV